MQIIRTDYFQANYFLKRRGSSSKGSHVFFSCNRVKCLFFDTVSRNYIAKVLLPVIKLGGSLL